MNIVINGKVCSCEKGEFLLQAARRNGIEIPTLCHHDGFPGQGSCRLCIVEVAEKGRKKVVVSCVYPVEQECEVFTESEKVQRERRMILTLLKKRAPESPEIQELCDRYQAEDIPRFVTVDGSRCVMCGLCVKACAELSVGAISTVNRGVSKEIATPYHEESAVCVGCGSCAYVCPTGAIPVTETEDTRMIWGKTFELVHCKECGRVIGTKQELHMAAAKAGTDPDVLCADCRKKRMADVMCSTYGE